MATKIRLRPRNVGRAYPVTYSVDFTKPPTPKEIELKKKKVQQVLKADKIAQEKALSATPVFNLRFEWTKTSRNPIEYKLKVDKVRDKRFKKVNGNGGGPTETPPIPKQPTPPPL